VAHFAIFMSNPGSRQSSLLRTLLIGAVLLALGYIALRALTPAKPALLAQARTPPIDPTWQDGSWYWIEAGPLGKPELVRFDGKGLRTVASAAKLTSYTIGRKSAVWAVQDAGRWSIRAADLDGEGPRTLWTGEREPHGLCVVDGRAYWLDQIPPAVPAGGPLPPLAATLQLLSISEDGGSPQVVGSLMEPEAGQVIGVRGGQAYVSAYRPGARGVTAIYRVPLVGGLPRRIAGEVGRQKALLADDGSLYWVAPSREASNPESNACIRRLGAGDKPETVAEWLPQGGRLFNTYSGICYVDGNFDASAWPLAAGRDIPRKAPITAGYIVLAAGGGELLLKPIAASGARVPLYRAGMP
jgi:hypothetical protein